MVTGIAYRRSIVFVDNDTIQNGILIHIDHNKIHGVLPFLGLNSLTEEGELRAYRSYS
jgi:hypothetical protein